MAGAFPSAAQNSSGSRPTAQARAGANMSFADNDSAAASGAFERCIERLESVVEQETAALKGRAATDLREFNNRKSQGLLELSRSMRYFGGAPPSNVVLARLAGLRTK